MEWEINRKGRSIRVIKRQTYSLGNW